MSKYISPCLNCQDRAVGCHGKEDDKWKCVAWGRYMDAKAEAFAIVKHDPMNSYAADRRRQRQHKKHMEKRR